MLALWVGCVSAKAEEGRLIATGGVMQVEGAAGGGLTTWAVIAGLSTDSQTDAALGASYLHTGDFTLRVVGAAYSWQDRFELSLAQQSLSLDTLRHAIDLRDQTLHQDVLGAKLKLAGDLVYDDLPQFVLGLEYKSQRDFALPEALGAHSDHGLDIYLGASRLLLDGPFHRNLLLNATLRATRANQFGLLGFGGGEHGGYSLQAEASTALFLDPHWALGLEYRQKPDNLTALREDNAYGMFLGWFPSKHVSLVLAYTDLGVIAGFEHQRGYYFSLNGNL